MSNAVFPSLIGLGWSVFRTSMWSTLRQQSASGKRMALGLWSSPIYQWDLSFDVLRSGLIMGVTYTEQQQVLGFYNARQGRLDTFLYTDADDNSVTGQALGTGNGVTTIFQLLRTLGGFVEPVNAPNAVTAVYLNGVLQSGGAWSVDAATGLLTFVAAPGGGVSITADFTYYFRCEFAASSSGGSSANFTGDTMSFEKFMDKLWTTGISFQSVK